MPQYFMLKLAPGRPDFAQTMTERERAVMQEHIVYWKKYMDQGIMKVFGPVMDPAGMYGLGIVAVEDLAALLPLIAADPAASLNHYEYYPMRAVFPGDK